jgi:hypothetical protein
MGQVKCNLLPDYGHPIWREPEARRRLNLIRDRSGKMPKWTMQGLLKRSGAIIYNGSEKIGVAVPNDLPPSVYCRRKPADRSRKYPPQILGHIEIARHASLLITEFSFVGDVAILPQFQPYLPAIIEAYASERRTEAIVSPQAQPAVTSPTPVPQPSLVLAAAASLSRMVSSVHSADGGAEAEVRIVADGAQRLAAACSSVSDSDAVPASEARIVVTASDALGRKFSSVDSDDDPAKHPS